MKDETRTSDAAGGEEEDERNSEAVVVAVVGTPKRGAKKRLWRRKRVGR